MTLRTFAIIFGVVFVVVGIAGYVDALTPDGRLFGLFAVDNAHNIIHLASGAAALVAGAMGDFASRRYFQIFAVIYGLVTILGLFVGNGELLGFVAHNVHDIWLHLVITVAAAWLGFGRVRLLARA